MALLCLEMDEKESDSLPSDLLTHIYTFLMQNSLQKAAKVLQKSCDIVSLLLSNIVLVMALYICRHWQYRIPLSQDCGSSIPTTRRSRVMCFY